MKTLIIAYELQKPEREYVQLFEAIKSLGKWSHCLESVWLVTSEYTPYQSKDILVEYLGYNDKIFVGILETEASWCGLQPICGDWINNTFQHHRQRISIFKHQ